jgi:hypothetical protein
VSFAQALEENPAPASLGDTALTFRDSILFGETAPHGGGSGGWARSSGLLTGAAGILVLLLPPTPGLLWVSGCLALVAGILLWLGGRIERHASSRRRFALHYATQKLRLELLVKRYQVQRELIPFAAIREVEIRGPPARLTLVWEPPTGGRREALLVDRVPESELEQLHRFRRTLVGAFGLPH